MYCLVSLVKCVGVKNSSQESLWKLQRRMNFIFVHWLLDTLINCRVLSNHYFSVLSDVRFQCSRAHELTCVCLCILKLSDTQVFLQIHSSPDSSEVAFTAEQTLLFYFAFSVILTCKLDAILIIILMAVRPCDWGKKWDTDNAKIIYKILRKLKWLLHREISSQKMYTFIVFLYSNVLCVYAE